MIIVVFCLAMWWNTSMNIKHVYELISFKVGDWLWFLFVHTQGLRAFPGGNKKLSSVWPRITEPRNTKTQCAKMIAPAILFDSMLLTWKFLSGSSPKFYTGTSVVHRKGAEGLVPVLRLLATLSHLLEVLVFSFIKWGSSMSFYCFA